MTAFWLSLINTGAQSQKAVTAHFSNEQLLPFDFAEYVESPVTDLMETCRASDSVDWDMHMMRCW